MMRFRAQTAISRAIDAGLRIAGRAHHCSSADWIRLSAAIRKFPDATTRSPGSRPAEHLDLVLARRAGRDRARLELALAAVDEHDPALARDDHGRSGHEHALAQIRVQRDVDEHLGPQREVAVAELEAHARRPRLARERGST